MSGLCQVIIKNTVASKEIPQSASGVSINRSQSLLTTNRIPVLAPLRSERIRLEALLSDVWTRDVLPFPGMTGRARSEHLVRASASSIMRKLSVASIASNFTKRSSSMASLHKSGETEPQPEQGELIPPRTDNTIGEDASIIEEDDSSPRNPNIAKDEGCNFFQNHSPERLPSGTVGSSYSPADTLRRLATLKVKRSWAADGQRVITPPLRASSASSLNQSKITPVSKVPDAPLTEDKENLPQIRPSQPSPNHTKPAKGNGKGRGAVAEGIRNLFR